jgi:hypothetical protein
MLEVTAATQAAGGLKFDPPRRALGLYNLNGSRPASAEELTSECEKRAFRFFFAFRLVLPEHSLHATGGFAWKLPL